jgi:hypothetical protein
MTTGCTCPTCGVGITPVKGQPCRGCEIGVMPEGRAKFMAKVVDRFLNGPREQPQMGCVRYTPDKEPGQ